MPQQNSQALSNEELQALLQPKVGAPDPYTYPGAGDWWKNLPLGALKGVGQTIEGGGDMIRRAIGAVTGNPNPDYIPGFGVVPSAHLNVNVQPSNYQQKVGSSLEHGAEYVLGAESVPFRTIPQALMGAGIAGAHTGGDPDSMLAAGVVGGLMPPITSAARNALQGLRGYIPQPILNWWGRGGPPPAAPMPPPGIPPTTGPQGPIQLLSHGGPQAAAQTGGQIGGAASRVTGAMVRSGPTAMTEIGPQYSWGQSTVKPQEIAGPTVGQKALLPMPTPPTPTGPKQLNAGPTQGIPAGTEPPLPPSVSDPRLPSSYQNTEPYPQAGPGIRISPDGKINLGDQGGVPARGEQTVTGTPRVKQGAVDVTHIKRGNVGKTATESPEPPPKKPK